MRSPGEHPLSPAYTATNYRGRLLKARHLWESVWKKQRPYSRDAALERGLRVTDKALKWVKDAELQNFVHESTIRDGQQSLLARRIEQGFVASP